MSKDRRPEPANAREKAIWAAAKKNGEPLPEKAEVELDPSLGQFGGVAMSTLTTGGHTFKPNEYLPPALVLSWPLRNRHALANTLRVAYFQEPLTPAAMAKAVPAEAAAIEALLS